MARNVEIKARVADAAALRERIAKLAESPPERLAQRDTFFVVPRGRLKLRQCGDGSGELIFYERGDQQGPKTSEYTRVACADSAGLAALLAAALAVRGVVDKRREVFLVGRTRVHLDDVRGLGTFIELEVVLRDGEPIAAGEHEARELLAALQITDTDLLAPAYIDLLEATVIEQSAR